MSKLKDLAKTFYHRTKREMAYGRAKASSESLQELERGALEDLKRDGFSVINGYYDRDQCKEMQVEVDRIISQYSDKLWRDEQNSDTRIFAAETVSPPIAKFHDDPFLHRLAKLYLADDQRCFFTLANKVVPTEGNLGSGGGWHRDTPHERQFKSIVYLSDVAEENGPFQYLAGSHHIGFLLSTIAKSGIQYGQHRFTEDEIERIANKSGVMPTRFAAAAGTLLLVDSSGIHQGSPIVSGCRYALTNYFFDAGTIEKLKERNRFVSYFVNREQK